MNIAMLHQYGLRGSGSANYAGQVCTELHARGHSVHMLCHEEGHAGGFPGAGHSRWTGTSFEVLHEPAPGSSIWVHHMPESTDAVTYRRAETPTAQVFTEMDDSALDTYMQHHIDAAATLTQWWDIDLWHMNSETPMGAVGSHLARVSGVPYVVCSHSSTIEYLCERDHRFAELARVGLRDASAVIALTDELRGRLCDLEPTVRDRVAVVPVGVDVSSFRPRPVDPGRPTRILFLGRLSTDKGLHVLLSALPALWRQRPDVEVLVAGGGEQASEMMAFADSVARGRNDDAAAILASLGCGRVHLEPVARSLLCSDHRPTGRTPTFLGPIDRDTLHELLPTCDVVVVPSLVNEGFPLVCLEALSSGVPFIAADHGGLAAVIEQFRGCVPQFDDIMAVPTGESMVDDLAESMITASDRMAAPAARIDAQRRCRSEAVARYAWPTVTAQLERVYERVLAEPRDPSAVEAPVSSLHRSHP